MPRAVANIEETTRHELKSLEGGFVILRRLTYGQIIERRSLLTMKMESGRNKEGAVAEFALANAEVAKFEFAKCIVDHNLEDENGNKLNLANPVDFQRLDPRVGQEIDSLITQMNNFDEELEGN